MIPNKQRTDLFVTTEINGAPDLEAKAAAVATELGARYFRRRSLTCVKVFQETGAQRLLVGRSNKWQLRNRDPEVVYQYHPNMSLVRAANLLRGQRDLFGEATQLTAGGSLLDCTVGFAAEASLAALLVGPAGYVLGLESVPELAVATREGLKVFPMPLKILEDAMRRVAIQPAHHAEFLKAQPDRSFDVVYFDPFFDDRLSGAEHSMDPLAFFGNTERLTPSAVRDAMRVARHRVVIKHPWAEPLEEGIAGRVTQKVQTRKGRLVYSVVEL